MHFERDGFGSTLSISPLMCRQITSTHRYLLPASKFETLLSGKQSEAGVSCDCGEESHTGPPTLVADFKIFQFYGWRQITKFRGPADVSLREFTDRDRD